MSTFRPMNVTCRVCGHTTRCTVLRSTVAFGAPDLDLRPAPLQRSTMLYWVHECRHCGYVAADLSKPTSADAGWLASKEYRGSKKLRFRSPLALRFYKQYLNLEHDGKREAAFHALLHAAWACDDAGDRKRAVFCRKSALTLLRELEKAKSDPNLILLQADLLRRAGCFTELKDTYKNVSLGNERMDRIIAFQLKKASVRDTGCYTVADAEK